MNAAHLHLLLNHLPVVGTLFGILLLAWAALRKNPELARAGLGMFVLLALMGAAAYFTGEPAEEMAENLPGVSESILERHEEAALFATLLLGAVGAVALGGLVAFRRRPVPRAFVAALLLLALAPAGAMAYTANLGGQIRHSEIRSGAVAAADGQDAERGEHEED